MSWKISLEISEMSWMSEYPCVGNMGVGLSKGNINFQTSHLRHVRARGPWSDLLENEANDWSKTPR